MAARTAAHRADMRYFRGAGMLVSWYICLPSMLRTDARHRSPAICCVAFHASKLTRVAHTRRPDMIAFGMDRPYPTVDYEENNHEATNGSDGDHRSHPTGSSAGGDSVASAEPRAHGAGATSGTGGVGDSNVWVGVSAASGGRKGQANWTEVGPEYLWRWFDLLAGHGDLVRRQYPTRSLSMQPTTLEELDKGVTPLGCQVHRYFDHRCTAPSNFAP